MDQRQVFIESLPRCCIHETTRRAPHSHVFLRLGSKRSVERVNAVRKDDQPEVGGTVTSIAPRWDVENDLANPSADPVYDQAIDWSIKDLYGQRDQLDRMRQRVVQFLIFFGSSTAFLAGALLNATQARPDQGIPARRDGWFMLAVGTSTFLALVSLLLAIFVLLAPEKSEDGKGIQVGRWQFRPPIEDVLLWADRDPSDPEVVDIKRAAINQLRDQRMFNDEKLLRVQHAYTAFIIVTILGLLCWTATTWILA